MHFITNKKVWALGALIAIVLAVIGLGAGAASATGDDPSADNKKVSFCHATSSETNPYVFIETSVMAFYNAGHIDHEGDIWEAFSYVDNKGETVNVPAQGDTSLLAFEDCQEPKVNEQVTRPDVTFADPCGTENDVFAVAGGRGFTVGALQTDGVIQAITVTLAEGFDWADGTRDPLRFERPAFTDVDCDLPNTGAAETATTAGYAALGGLGVLALIAVAQGRRQRQED